MSKLYKEQSSTNNQSTERLVQEITLQPKPDFSKVERSLVALPVMAIPYGKSKVKKTVEFLYNNGNTSLTLVGIAYHSKAGLRRTKAILKGINHVSI